MVKAGDDVDVYAFASVIDLQRVSVWWHVWRGWRSVPSASVLRLGSTGLCVKRIVLLVAQTLPSLQAVVEYLIAHCPKKLRGKFQDLVTSKGAALLLNERMVGAFSWRVARTRLGLTVPVLLAHAGQYATRNGAEFAPVFVGRSGLGGERGRAGTCVAFPCSIAVNTEPFFHGTLLTALLACDSSTGYRWTRRRVRLHSSSWCCYRRGLNCPRKSKPQRVPRNDTKVATAMLVVLLKAAMGPSYIFTSGRRDSSQRYVCGRRYSCGPYPWFGNAPMPPNLALLPWQKSKLQFTFSIPVATEGAGACPCAKQAAMWCQSTVPQQ